MTPLLASFRFRALPALLISLTLAFSWLTVEAQETKRSFEIPAGKAEVTLKQFADQAGIQFFFSADKVAGVNTHAVKGEMSASDALGVMLAQTELLAVRDAMTGAYTIRRSVTLPEAEKNVPSRPANSGAASSSITADGTLVLDKVEVTGSRIRGVLGEATVSPILIYTRQDIERTGVTSLADFKKYIPQLSVGDPTRMDGTSSGFSAQSRVTYNLRGIGNNSTLVLVDGRRLARSGQDGSSFGNDDFDLNGIPLSAVERIDVLLDGASAIYGADAMAGVINVILKKEYSGTEVELSYDNTFDKDAAVKRVSLTHGFRKNDFSLLLSASEEDTSALASADRSWTSSTDLRPYGGSDGRTVRSDSGQLSVASGKLPGLTTGVAGIPSGANGTSATAADYGAAPLAGLFDAGQWTNSINPSHRESVMLRLSYDFWPWLQPFLDGRWNRTNITSKGQPPTLTLSTLPAGYPGNPFGVPVRLQKIFWDLGPTSQRYTAENPAATFGVKGDFHGNWHYEASGNWTRSDQQTVVRTGNFNTTLVNAAIAKRSVLLAYDSLTGNPNPAGVLEALENKFGNPETSDDYTYDFNLSGSLLELPAGPVRVAAGTEYREEKVSFGRDPADPNYNAFVTSAPTRNVWAGFAEVAVPVVGQKQQLPLLHQVEVQFAGRVDDYNDFGRGTSPRIGALWWPAKWLLLRGTHSKAFKAPILTQLYTPTQVANQTYTSTSTTAFTDPLRNNSFVTGVIATTTGGNPNLRPEESTNDTVGIVFEVPRVKGLSLSVDYWDIAVTNRVGGVSLQDRIVLFPELFTRGPADGIGTAGPVTAIDARSVNVAEFNTAGYDFRLTWEKRTPWGDFTLTSSATRTTKYEARPKAGAPALTTTIIGQRPIRSVSSLYWNHRGLEAGVTATYEQALALSSLASAQVPSTIQWDVSTGYDFDTGNLLHLDPQSWVGRACKGASLRFSLLNVLNEEPRPSSIGLFSGTIDPRLRRYVLTLRKRF